MSLQRPEDPGRDLPRIGLFLFDCGGSDALRETLSRIPAACDDWLSEVVVMQDPSSDAPLPELAKLTAERDLALRIHREPRSYGYGGARKAAFEYALRRGFDFAVTMRGDGIHPPELLPELIAAGLDPERPLVCATPLARRLDWLRVQRRPADALLHRFGTAFQNAVLGLRLNDYHSGYRVYPVGMLARIPFQLDANDRSFDSQIVVQCRALGAPVKEIAAELPWREDPEREGSAYVLRSCWSALDYRLHQLHVTKAGRYLVDRDVRYTLKRSRTGSHMQIVAAIRPGSRVLDLGCSQGLLAGPLREKDVRVTGVDEGPPERLLEELDGYFQHDLEQPLELPTGRVFDYVVVSDVIEHVRNRAQLLRTARRYLKEDGRLLISTPNIAIWFYRLSLLAGRFEYGPRGVLDETHVHLFTRASFRREVEKAGFHVLEQRVTALPFEVVFQSTGRSRLLRSVAHAYHALARLWPSMFAYQHILEAETTTLDDESTVRLEVRADGSDGR